MDYRSAFNVSELSGETRWGDGVRVAVVDTGVPVLDDIRVGLSANFTHGPLADEAGHATFVGSILFGRGVNGIHGVCGNATACFAKVFHNSVTNPVAVANAIAMAAGEWKADVINLSLGFAGDRECPTVVKKACEDAAKAGVVIVAAAGNSGGKVMWPAALPCVVSVGSELGGERDEFSNSDSIGNVDFAVRGRDLEGYATDGSVVRKTGTSFSTAVVSGMVALLIAKMRMEGAKVDVDSVRKRLAATCLDIAEEGYDASTGHGVPFGVSAVRRGGLSRLSVLPLLPFFGKIVVYIATTVRTLAGMATKHKRRST